MRTNRDTVVEEMKRALDVIQMVVTDSGGGVGGTPASDVVIGGKEQQRDVNLNSHHSPPLSTVNAADSGISLSQLQTSASRAIKDFEVYIISDIVSYHI